MSVTDGNTGNLNGLVICENVPTGKTVKRVKLAGRPRDPECMDFRVGDLVSGRVFVRDGVPQAYLWRNDGVQKVTLELPVPQGEDIRALYVDGSIVRPDENNMLRIVLDEDWAHESPLVSGAGKELLKTAKVF